MNDLFDEWARIYSVDEAGYIVAYGEMERAWDASAREAINKIKEAYPKSGCYQILEAHFGIKI